MDSRLFRTAFRDTVPVMTGYVFLGFGFGILALQNDLSIWWAMAMSVLIYAGSMRFVAVTMLTRFLPFLIFGEKREPPRCDLLSGQGAPLCRHGHAGGLLPEGAGFFRPRQLRSGAALHRAGGRAPRDTLLSIGVGTVAYMLLVQLVF